MIPLAGPYSGEATIGGIVAANISESRRRGYGTARDIVIACGYFGWLDWCAEDAAGIPKGTRAATRRDDWS